MRSSIICLAESVTTALVWSGGRAVEQRTVNRGDGGSTPPPPFRNFISPHICWRFSEETLKASGPSYLVSMPGEAPHSYKACISVKTYKWPQNLVVLK